jgi:hypothetical protein
MTSRLSAPSPAQPSTPSHSSSGLARFADLAFRDRTRGANAAPPILHGAPLFTHHQIVELAAPFARCGLVLDLAASDRMRRRLVFRSVQHSPMGERSERGDAVPPAQALEETIQLESPRHGYFRLTRTLAEHSGLHATLYAEGARPGDLLACVQAVPPKRQFHSGAGYRIAYSGCIAASGKDFTDHGGPGKESVFRLTHARVQTSTLRLDVSVSATPSAAVTSASVELRSRHPTAALPHDLLAVLGWDWSLLQTGLHSWQGSLRLRGHGASRDDDAAHKLCLAGAHLAQTLSEPPTCFHQRLRAARWWTSARHALPVLACAVLALEALFADALHAARGSPLTLAVMCIPPALLLLLMLRSERPRLELPTWPRPLPAQAWEAAP